LDFILRNPDKKIDEAVSKLKNILLETKEEIELLDSEDPILERYESILANDFNNPTFKKIVEKSIAYIKSLDKIITYSELLEDEYDEDLELDSIGSESYGREAFQVNPKDSASARMKKFLAFIPERIKNTKGAFENKVNIFNMTSYLPYDVVYNNLVLNLSNVPIEEIYDRLQELGRYNSMYHYIAEKLNEFKNSKNQDSVAVYKEFMSNFSKQHAKFVTAQFTKNDNNNTLRFIYSNRREANELIITNWYENFKNTNLNKNVKYSNNQLVYDLKRINKILENYRIIKDNQQSIEVKLSYLRPLLKDLGIDISPETISIIVNSPQLINRKYTATKFLSSVYRIFESLESIKEGDNAIDNNPFSKESNNIKMLSLAELLTNNNVYSTMFRNEEGKNIYSVFANHALSKKMRDLFNANSTFRLALNNSPFHKDSFITQKLNSGEWNSTNFEYAIFSNFNKIGDYGNGKPFKNLSPQEREITKLIGFMNEGNSTGWFISPTQSDKPTIPFIKMPKFRVSFVNNRLDSESLNNLYSIYISEFNRIREAHRLIDAIKTTTDPALKKRLESKLVLNYHYKKDKLSKDGEAFKFVIFPTLNKTSLSTENSTFLLTDPLYNPEVHKEQILNALNDIFIKLKEEKIKQLQKLNLVNNKGNILSKYIDVNYSKQKDKDIDLLDSYIYNSLLSQIVYSSLMDNDLAFTKNLDDASKRAAKNLAPGLDFFLEGSFRAAIVKDIYYPLKNKDKFLEDLKSIVKDKKTYDKLVEEYSKDMNGTDAQAIVTLDTYEKMLDGLGRLDKDYKRIINKIRNNQKLSNKDLYKVLGPLKPVYVEDVWDDTLKVYVPKYIKFSAFPLINELVNNNNFTQLKELKDKMENKDNPVDILFFESASKIGSQGIQPIVNENYELLDLDPDNINVLPWSGMRLQQEVPFDAEKNKVNLVSQARKLLFEALKEFDANAEEKKALFEDLHLYTVQENYRNLIVATLESYYDPETKRYQINNIDKFKEVILREAESRGFDENFLQALETLDNKFLIPLYLTPYSEQIESLLLSIFTNKLVKQKMSGKSFVQASNFAFNKVIDTESELFKNAKNKIQYIRDNSNSLDTLSIESETKIDWSRYKKENKNNYEVSSKGDKRFSALYAKLNDGRTIEEAYQLDVKGYRVQGNDWKLGKGKAPLNKMTKEESYQAYKSLWEQYLNENPDLEKDLYQKAKGKTLTDQFATTDISQARALSDILNERFNQKSNEEARTLPEGIYLPNIFKSYFSDINNIPEELLRVVGFRIPNQGHNLMVPLKIQGFLPPSMGDLVVVSPEMLKRMGSDFDVDKLYIYFKNVDPITKQVVKYSESLDEKDVENRYVEKVEELLALYLRENKSKLKTFSFYKKEYEKAIKSNKDTQRLLEDYAEQLEEAKTREEEDEIREKIELLNVKTLFLNKEFKEIEEDYITSKKSLINELINKKYIPDFETFKEQSPAAQNTLKARQNKIIDMYLDVLTNPKLLERMLKPNEIDVLKEVNDHYSQYDEQTEVISPFSSVTQDAYFESNVVGKTAVGITSLFSTFFSQAQYTNFALKTNDVIKGVKFKKDDSDELYTDVDLDKAGSYNNKELFGLFKLNKIRGVVNNTYISDILQIFQSAAVDNAKEQQLNKANLNIETLPTAMYIAISGIDDLSLIVGFLKQPAIVKYIEILKASKSSLNKYVKTTYEEEAEIQTINYFNNKIKELKGKPFTATDIGIFSKKGLENNLKINKNLESLNNQQKILFYEAQLKILHTYMQYSNTAAKLTEVINGLNIDTQSVGKNFTDLVKNINLSDKYRESTQLSEEAVKALPFRNVDDFYTKTFAGELMDKAYRPVISLYNNNSLYPYNSKLFYDINADILKSLGSDELSQKLSRDVKKALIQFLMTYKKNNLYSTEVTFDEYRKNILKGIGARLLKYKTDNPDNWLMQRMNIELADNKELFVDKITLNTNQLESTERIYGMKTVADMLSSDNAEEALLAKDLIAYSYLTTGGLRSSNGLSSIIPIEYLVSIGFGDAYNSKEFYSILNNNPINEIKMSKLFVQQFFRNNPNKAPEIVNGRFSKDKRTVSIDITKNTTPDTLLVTDFVKLYNKEKRRSELYMIYDETDTHRIFEKVNQLNNEYSMNSFLTKSVNEVAVEVPINKEETPTLNSDLLPTSSPFGSLLDPSQLTIDDLRDQITDEDMVEGDDCGPPPF